jgi:lipopolysaccharide transport system ATP-binding protein
MHSLTAEGLGKRYTITPPDSAEVNGIPGADLLRRVRRLLRREAASDGAAAQEAKEFWALKDVSFTVEPGTILGIIGPNGAGKSTLLKILARVTPPTEGRVSGQGRVVSLLELGAGFDPDLDARDNVVMNAAMHGIPKHEVLERLPAILEFAEIERFSRMPLRHYSSGMYLRLAFSVVINMNPQILLADEILAVGDMAFQERCLQKVEESGRKGLIVLFVSHDMEALARVCNRVLWLHKGQVRQIGDPEDVIGDYQDAVWSDVDSSASERGRQTSRFAAIRGVKLLSSQGQEIGAAPTDEDIYLSIAVEAFKAVWVKGAIDLHARKQFLFRATDADFREIPDAGLYELRVRIPSHLLTDISYQVTVSVTTRREGQQREYRLVSYDALSFMAYNSQASTEPVKGRVPRTGLLAPRLEWEVAARHVVEA